MEHPGAFFILTSLRATVKSINNRITSLVFATSSGDPRANMTRFGNHGPM